MPPPVRHAIQEAVASGVGVVFQWAIPVIILACLVSLLLREVPLRNDVNVDAAAIEGMEEAGFGMLGEPGPLGMGNGRADRQDRVTVASNSTLASIDPARMLDDASVL